MFNFLDTFQVVDENHKTFNDLLMVSKPIVTPSLRFFFVVLFDDEIESWIY